MNPHFSVPQSTPIPESSVLQSHQMQPQEQPKQAQPVPRRFRTAFIIFSSYRHREIRAQLGQHARTEKTANISRLVSAEWRQMTPEQKEIWQERAREDKLRYNREMLQYKDYVKTHSGSTAEVPKRPMSAYLAFSNKRRGPLKRLYPNATNSELSKMLAKAWKEADPEVKAEYVQTEARLRAQYNIDMAPFRNKKSRKSKSKQAMHNNFSLAVETFGNNTNDNNNFSCNQFGQDTTPAPLPNRLADLFGNDQGFFSNETQGQQQQQPPQMPIQQEQQQQQEQSYCNMQPPLPQDGLSAEEELLQQLDSAKAELIRKIRARRQNMGLVNTHTQFQQKQILDSGSFLGGDQQQQQQSSLTTPSLFASRLMASTESADQLRRMAESGALSLPVDNSQSTRWAAMSA